LDQAAQDPTTFWNVNFWKKNVPATILTLSAAKNMADIIYNSFGAFDDNEEQAIGVFKSLKFQTQASFLSDIFSQTYKQDLLTFLRGGNWPKDRLSDAQVSEINSFIEKLPIK